MAGFAVEVKRESLGSGPPELELVYVLSDTPADALTLVKTALQLTTETVTVAGRLSAEEVAQLQLKPYQVRHAR